MKNIIFYVLLITFITTKGQRFTVFGGPGLSFYQGDLSEGFLPNSQTMKTCGKLGLDYLIYNHIGIRFHTSGSILHHSDTYSSQIGRFNRGISFTTYILQGGFQLKIDRIFGAPKTKFINYLYSGLDLAVMDVSKTYSQTSTLVAEGRYSNFQFIIPIGGGIGYWVNPEFGLVYEFCLNVSNTDYLDGVSYNGQPKGRDTYVNNNIILIYRFGPKVSGKSSSTPYKFHLFETPQF
jgi:hypothetical protein